MPAFASVEGSTSIRSDARSFVEAFRRRIEAGLLSGKPHPRSRYVITRIEKDRLEFRAVDWLTAVNVGLNQVAVTVDSRGRAQYAVRYPRWARFAVGWCAAIGSALAVVFLAIDLPDYLARQPDSTSLGLTPEQGVVVAWAMVLFWGFAWPWILIAVHRKPLRQLMDRLIAEIDADAVRGSSSAAR